MRKILALTIILGVSLNLYACKKDIKNEEDGLSKEEVKVERTLNIVLLANRTLGGDYYIDLAREGLKLAKEEFKERLEYELVDIKGPGSDYLKFLNEYSTDPKWDLIILAFPPGGEGLKEVTKKYPSKKYIVLETNPNPLTSNLENVYKIRYKEEEGGFLLGGLSARLSETKTIGLILNKDYDLTKDFLIGYIEGARYLQEDVKIITSYIEDSTSKPTAKDLALLLYKEEGVDVISGLDKLTSLDILKAAYESGKFALGTDLDHGLLIEDNLALSLPTSLIKNLDKLILKTISLEFEDRLNYGSDERFGISEGAYTLANNEYYKRLVPQKTINELDEIKLKISNGQIKVPNGSEKTRKEVESLIN